MSKTQTLVKSVKNRRKKKGTVASPVRAYYSDPEAKREFLNKVNLSPKKVTKDIDPKRREICMRVRKIRLDNNMTLEEFGNAIKEKPESMKAIERGAYAPNIRIMEALKYRFKITYDYLIEGL